MPDETQPAPVQASWQQDGRGLGAVPPSNQNQLEPASGKPDNEQIEPDTSGVPPQAVQGGPGGNPPGSGGKSLLTRMAVNSSGTIVASTVTVLTA